MIEKAVGYQGDENEDSSLQDTFQMLRSVIPLSARCSEEIQHFSNLYADCLKNSVINE